MVRAQYVDTWIVPVNDQRKSSNGSSSKSNASKASSSVSPTPETTPTRYSRSSAATYTHASASDERYHSFSRSFVDGRDRTDENSSIVFQKNDVVIISSAAKTPLRKEWLKPVVLVSNRNGKKVEGPANVLANEERVAIIKSFYEENRGEMRCRIHWLAVPASVWRGDANTRGETWEKNELYYTTDSVYLEAEQCRLQHSNPYSSTSRSPSSLSANLSRSSCHSTEDIDILYVLRHATILPSTSSTKLCPSSTSSLTPPEAVDRPTFIVKKLYDVRPIGQRRFIGPIDWNRVYKRGQKTGEWDVEGVDEDETSSEPDSDDVVDDGKKFEKKPKSATGIKKVAPIVRRVSKKEVQRQENIRKEVKLANKARLVQKKYASEDDESESGSESDGDEETGDEGSGDNFSDKDMVTPGRKGIYSDSDDDSTDDDDDASATEDDDRSPPSRKRCRSSSPPSHTRRLAKSASSKGSPSKKAKVAAYQMSANAATRKRLRETQPRLPAASFPTDRLNLNANPFQLACARLHASATPENLTGREEEQEQIRDRVGEAIRKARGELFFISGVPGTGKTATVYSALRSLNEDEDVDAFEFVEINGMKIAEPNQAFSLLWEALSGGQKVQPRLALTHLEKHFATPKIGRKTTVVLVDELDQMVTKKQDVIYNFFNWPHMAHSKLIVIAIANTMDLPERELSGKIRSRLGSNRINFKTYLIPQLEAIVHARLEGLLEKVIEPAAIILATKKVGTVSGDARRVLDVCRRSIEKVNQLNSESPSNQQRKCSIQDVISTYKEMSDFGSTAFIKQLPLHSKIMLLALVQCIKKAGVPEVEFNTVLRWHLDFCRQISLNDIPSHDQLFTTLTALHTLRIVATESQRLDYYQRVRSLVSDSDIFTALENEAMLARHLPRGGNGRRM